MKKHIGMIVVSIIALSSVSFVVIADDDHDDDKKGCTAAAINAAESYDPGSSAMLECIDERDDFKVLMSWNSKATNGNILKKLNQKVGQQVVNARNLVRDYSNNYAMTHGDEYDMVVIAYSGGVDWLKKGNDPADINIVQGLLDKGVKIYACQNTMKAKNLKLADLIDGIGVVPAGVSAVVDFSNRKYTYINP